MKKHLRNGYKSLTGRGMILMKMYVRTFKTDVIGFICEMCLMSHYFSVSVSSLILTMALVEIKGKMSNLPFSIWKKKTIYLPCPSSFEVTM
jgi:hypothetical protein